MTKPKHELPRESLCHSPGETMALGRLFASVASVGVILSLEGPLGAGKTEFVKGLADGVGASADEVCSPTFTLVHEYAGGRVMIAHFDFYRLNSPGELRHLGFEDYLGEAVLVIEWGDKFPELLPADVIRLQFEVTGDNSRRIVRME